MNNAKFFLKFGKKENLESLVTGNLYCSNANTFWEIERKMRMKGQGDILEAGSKIFCEKMYLRDIETGNTRVFDIPSEATIHYEPAEKIPVFCLFSVFESDCTTAADGSAAIRLSDRIKRCISEHFPRADAVAIISNPERFIADVKDSIGCRIEHDFVHYYHIAEGIDNPLSGQKGVDMEYVKYLTQDVPPMRINGMIERRFLTRYVYRALLCKDVFFSDEQEYRIVLPDETISAGTLYPVKISEDIPIISLSDFMQ